MNPLLAAGPVRLPGNPVSPADFYVRSSKAANTIRAYQADLRDFEAWCSMRSRIPLPASPATVADYLAQLADVGAATSTITRRAAAISKVHQLAGLPSPTQDTWVRDALAGIRRQRTVAPRQKAALSTAEIRRLLAGLDRSTNAGARDAALLLIGFASGRRRSELAALQVRDLVETEDGLRITIRRSKTDQEGQGEEVGIPWGSHPETCPVRALRWWLELSSITEGPLWRRVDRHDRILEGDLGDRAVALIVKRAAVRAGLPAESYAGHSLRAGLATSAVAAGAPERAIMKQTGHRSVAVARRYIRSGSLFQENAAAYLGL